MFEWLEKEEGQMDRQRESERKREEEEEKMQHEQHLQRKIQIVQRLCGLIRKLNSVFEGKTI